MSALGQKQTLSGVRSMSALPPKAHIAERDWDVRFVPKADIMQRSKSIGLYWDMCCRMPAGGEGRNVLAHVVTFRRVSGCS